MKDFDTLAPPKRIAKIGGEEIDVSIMSARVSLKFVAFSEKYGFGTNALSTVAFDPQMINDMVDIIALICQKSSKKITADWLLDNLELPVLIEFMHYVFDPMLARLNKLKPGESGEETGKGEPGKN